MVYPKFPWKRFLIKAEGIFQRGSTNFPHGLLASVCPPLEGAAARALLFKGQALLASHRPTSY
jgi:hypothetical protein